MSTISDTYICIDIGGTAIKYGVLDGEANTILKKEIPSDAHLGGPHIMHLVRGIIRELHKEEIKGIAISSAGMVDVEKGEIFYSGPQIPNYAGTKFKSELEKEFLLPVEVENDVNCAGLAESISGAGKDSRFNLCLTIGTGIGGCFVMDKEVYHGAGSSACEVGYMDIDGKEFQHIAATTYLVETVRKIKNDATINGVWIFDQAQKGDTDCVAAIDMLCENLGRGIANICYVLNPDMVILGGGIMARSDYLFDRIEKAIKKRLVPSIAAKTNLAFAKYGNQAGMIGALYTFMLKQTKRRL